MRPVLRAALALAVLLPLAGCVGGDDAQAQSDADATTSATRGPRDGASANATATGRAPGQGPASAGGNATGDPGNATGNATGNGTGPAGGAPGNGSANAAGNATWSYDNRTGRVGGTGPVAVLTATHEADESVAVANGTENLTVHVTVRGRDATVTIQPPGCDEDDCRTELEVEDGVAQQAGFDAPDAGNWTFTVGISGSGSIEAQYELDLAQLAVRGNGTA